MASPAGRYATALLSPHHGPLLAEERLYTRTLFPVDGSDMRSKALRHALDLAKLCGAKLHVLSAKELFH